MKFRHRLYRKIADYFYAKLPVETVAETYDDGKPAYEVLTALKDKVSNLPSNSMIWSRMGKDDSFIKHMKGDFYLKLEDNKWKISVALGNNIIFSSNIPSTKANLAEIDAIYAVINDKATREVISLLKGPESSEDPINAKPNV